MGNRRARPSVRGLGATGSLPAATPPARAAIGIMRAMADSEVPAPRPMIRGERVWLRPIEPSDIVTDSGFAGDSEVGHFMGAKLPMCFFSTKAV